MWISYFCDDQILDQKQLKGRRACLGLTVKGTNAACHGLVGVAAGASCDWSESGQEAGPGYKMPASIL